MFETGAGLGFVFFAFVVFIVGTVITSQTLVAAVASSVREYAMLNALGAGYPALRRVVLEQAFWVGGSASSSARRSASCCCCWHAARACRSHSTSPPALPARVLVMTHRADLRLGGRARLSHLEPANLLR